MVVADALEVPSLLPQAATERLAVVTSAAAAMALRVRVEKIELIGVHILNVGSVVSHVVRDDGPTGLVQSCSEMTEPPLPWGKRGF